MRNWTDTFSFDIPEGWTIFVENRRFVAQGKDGEELILSSWAPQPSADTAPAIFDAALDKLVENAKAAATETVADSDLIMAKPLVQDTPAGGLFPCWTIFSEAPNVCFHQAEIRGSSAVMLATLEAPISPERESQFREFLSSFGMPVPRA